MTPIQLKSLGWSIVVTLLLVAPAMAESGAAALDRTVLPIAAPKPPQYVELDVRNATPPPRFEVEGAGGCAERGRRPGR